MDETNRGRSLLKFAQQVEDAASGLHKFRDDLPREAVKITGALGELFAISGLLNKICSAEKARQYEPSFWRIDEDLALLFKTLKLTLNGIFGMFARTQDRPPQMIWEDLQYRFDKIEGFKLQQRLELYRDSLEAQIRVLEGRKSSSLRSHREALHELLEAQQGASSPAMDRVPPPISGASTPRPRRQSRPPYPRMDTPSTPSVLSDDWDMWDDDRPPVVVPEPPLPMPISPTFTSGSSESMYSSQTSYSSEGMYALPRPDHLLHWAMTVYDGSSPMTRYKSQAQLVDHSVCYGPPDATALQNLIRDGFQKAMQVAFDGDIVVVTMYWRPSDNRARILITMKDRYGEQSQICTPITNLKVIRHASTLQLCRARRDGKYTLWARLNFMFHERMVLFYNTFVAMKAQDERGIDSPNLIDAFELSNDSSGEKCLFAGQIKHGDMLHALRLWYDRSSGVVRLEAGALRGPRKDVPIWTAFVTKYAHDADHCQYETRGVVSIAAIRPPPYVFISRYEPPVNSLGDHVLPFSSDADARMFMETWAGLSRLI